MIIEDNKDQEKPRKYFITDWESGYLQEVTKEEHQAFMRLFESFRPSIAGSTKGMVIVFGTGGDLNQGDFSSMFFNPININKEH